MSPTLEFLGLVFMFVVRVGVPILVLFGILYLFKRWLEPRSIRGDDDSSRTRWRVAIPPVLIALASLLALGIVLVMGYALVMNRFIDLLMVFRDAATLACLFLLRIAVPLILVIGIGAWLERKLNPGVERERRSLRERLPMLQRLPALPHLSPRGILGVTFIAALWTAFLGVTIGRFFFGLSYVTNMTDQYAWGLWLAFDMISGVALSAGGFGVVLNRLNTTVLGWWTYTSGGPIYVPTLGGLIGTVSLISIGVVAFGLIAKNFPVFEHVQHVHAPAE